MDKPDKRRARRSKHDSVLEIFDDEGKLVTGIGRLIDFSTSGVCFSTLKKFNAGDLLHARLRLLREGALDIAARVVWVKKKPMGNQYGVSFEAIQPVPRSE